MPCSRHDYYTVGTLLVHKQSKHDTIFTIQCVYLAMAASYLMFKTFDRYFWLDLTRTNNKAQLGAAWCRFSVPLLMPWVTKDRHHYKLKILLHHFTVRCWKCEWGNNSKSKRSHANNSIKRKTMLNIVILNNAAVTPPYVAALWAPKSLSLSVPGRFHGNFENWLAFESEDDICHMGIVWRVLKCCWQETKAMTKCALKKKVQTSLNVTSFPEIVVDQK